MCVRECVRGWVVKSATSTSASATTSTSTSTSSTHGVSSKDDGTAIEWDVHNGNARGNASWCVLGDDTTR